MQLSRATRNRVARDSLTHSHRTLGSTATVSLLSRLQLQSVTQLGPLRHDTAQRLACWGAVGSWRQDPLAVGTVLKRRQRPPVYTEHQHRGHHGGYDLTACEVTVAGTKHHFTQANTHSTWQDTYHSCSCVASADPAASTSPASCSAAAACRCKGWRATSLARVVRTRSAARVGGLATVTTSGSVCVCVGEGGGGSDKKRTCQHKHKRRHQPLLRDTRVPQDLEKSDEWHEYTRAQGTAHGDGPRAPRDTVRPLHHETQSRNCSRRPLTAVPRAHEAQGCCPWRRHHGCAGFWPSRRPRRVGGGATARGAALRRQQPWERRQGGLAPPANNTSTSNKNQ